jgi:threonine/homoserine efflux transporter RhtA
VLAPHWAAVALAADRAAFTDALQGIALSLINLCYFAAADRTPDLVLVVAVNQLTELAFAILALKIDDRHKKPNLLKSICNLFCTTITL